MGDVKVRNLDDSVIDEWKARASRHGRSIGAELCQFLTEEAMRPRQEAISHLRALQETMHAAHGVLPDSAIGIQTERDARG